MHVRGTAEYERCDKVVDRETEHGGIDGEADDTHDPGGRVQRHEASNNRHRGRTNEWQCFGNAGLHGQVELVIEAENECEADIGHDRRVTYGGGDPYEVMFQHRIEL